MTQKELHHQLETLHKESYGWALRCCFSQKEMAEDVLQQVYLKILEGKAIYKAKSSFKTWLFSVIRYCSIDLLRDQKRYQEKIQFIKVVESHSSTYEETAYPEENPTEDLEMFRKLLDNLPMRQKEVLQLVFYHNCSIAEAANIMKVSLGAARKHYSRAKDSLRKKLQHLSIS